MFAAGDTYKTLMSVSSNRIVIACAHFVLCEDTLVYFSSGWTMNPTPPNPLHTFGTDLVTLVPSIHFMIHLSPFLCHVSLIKTTWASFRSCPITVLFPRAPLALKDKIFIRVIL